MKGKGLGKGKRYWKRKKWLKKRKKGKFFYIYLKITRVIALRSRWVIIIVVGRNERDPKGVDLFIFAFQRFEGHVAFLGRGTPPFPPDLF